MDRSNTRRSLRRRLTSVLKHSGCRTCGCPHLTKRSDAVYCSKECRWEASNEKRPKGSYRLRYHSRILPDVSRIKALITVTPLERRARLADLLLRHVKTEILQHHEVDEFIATYNTEGV